jgi:inosine/xanthosine triphosphate pyrophosphatase family protein
VPDGHTRTSGELDAETKDAISHRGQSLRKLGDILAGQPTDISGDA